MNDNSTKKGWMWFAAIVLVILGLGAFIGLHRRRELGKSFAYNLDEYRKVDPALVRFEETGRIVPDLGKLKALTVTPEDRIVVAGVKGLAVYSPKGSRIATYPVDETPTCLAADDEGRIYVGHGNRIAILNSDGKWEPEWPPIDPKTYLTSIAVSDKFVFAADAANRVVWRLDPRTGRVLGKIGARDPKRKNKEFVIPSPYFDIAVGNDDSLWVVDTGRHSLKNYHPDGELISSWEKTSMRIEGFCGCCNPTHIVLRQDGSFVTSEKGIPRVKIHGPAGDLVCVVAPPDCFDKEVRGLDLAVDSAGRILVLDPHEKAVRIFTEKER